mmetsp:Transcript_44013/g.112389  ORF Transcript_44013/g.112389 Transcript_44013/m.112389 type:complete len:90 (-) Transcript_44013:27-296(-)
MHNYVCDYQDKWRKMKRMTFRTLNLDAFGNMDFNVPNMKSLRALTFSHFMGMFHPAWEHGFTTERNLIGWNKEGITPFTRAPLTTFKRQ